MTLPTWARPRRRNPLKGLPLGYVARFQRLHLLAIDYQGQMLLLATSLINGHGLAMAAPGLATYYPTVMISGRHFICANDIDKWMETSTRARGAFEAWLCDVFIPAAT